jgi:hypothetical protein
MTTQAVWRLRESVRLSARGSFSRNGPNNKFHKLLRWPSADGDFGKFRPFAFWLIRNTDFVLISPGEKPQLKLLPSSSSLTSVSSHCHRYKRAFDSFLWRHRT